MKRALAIILIFALAMPTFAGVSSNVNGDTSNYLTKKEVEEYMSELKTFTNEMVEMVGNYAERRTGGSFERVKKKIATKSNSERRVKKKVE